MNRKTLALLCLAGACVQQSALTAQTRVEAEPQQNLYITNPESARPYRIPAIAAAPNGDVFAISDYRPCGNDIGYGEVDIKCRISKDNGKTWGEEFFIADGEGGTSNRMATGYGDAAIVADREENKLLVMMVCGRTVCWHGRWNPSKIGQTEADSVNRVARVYLTYNEKTGEWEKGDIVEMTDHIYSLFLDGDKPTVSSMFIGSGKICQSSRIKVGKYYRLYCSMWTRDGGNRVIYSDDFGDSWRVLGTIYDRPAPGGDEPKVEELPDGSVLLSSRCAGRYFNIYTYTDVKKGKGSWATVALSNADNNGVAAVGNSTNGEILIVPVQRKADGVKTYLALQSVPFGPGGRKNVGIFYKELTDYATDFASPALFATNWDGSHQSSTMGSAYTTMTLQKDNTIGFLYEESTFARDYTIVYKNYTIEHITDNRYAYCDDQNLPKTYISEKVVGGKVTSAFTGKECKEVVGMPNLNMRKSVEKVAKKAQKRATVDAVAKLNKSIANTVFSPIDGNKYRLRNLGYLEGNKAYNDNQYLQASPSGFSAAALTLNDESLIWTLQKTAEGSWRLYNEKHQVWMGKPTGTSVSVMPTKNIAEAGTFLLTSDREGKTVFNEQHTANVNYPCFHLSQANTIVTWNASSPSKWEIISVEKK
ncbi:MAG: exo-alpha-sialidase [Bacteroidaceae bacterium]|nr:exo-alpha-sialidase [Bacteroidaceae bacterium]